MVELETSKIHGDRDLRYFFGHDAVILRNRDGLVIRNQLSDATCPGGQQTEIEMLPRTLVKQYHFGTDYVSPDYPAYPCKRITINGLTLSLPPVLFIPPDRKMRMLMKYVDTSFSDERKQEVTTKRALQDARLARNTHATVSHIPGFIALNSFQTSDDVAALFHEVGEVNTGNSMKRAEAFFTLHEIRKKWFMKVASSLLSILTPELRKEFKSDYIGNEIFGRLRTILNSERTASQYAMKHIRHLNQSRQLFPADADNLRLRKFYQGALLTYRNFGDGFFNNFLSDDQNRQLDTLVELK